MSKTLGLKFQSRVLRSFAPSESSAWIVATNCLREENEIRVVEYDEKKEALTSPTVYVHHDEVWDLVLDPEGGQRLVTAHNSKEGRGVTLWKVEEGKSHLQKLSSVGVEGTDVRRLEWSERTNILTLQETKLQMWDVQGNSAQAVASGSGQDLDQFSNLHVPDGDPAVVFVANGQGYQIWDIRDMKMQQTVPHCHEMPLRSLDTVQNQVATCGDDCLVKLWDRRTLDKVLAELPGHSHWVWDCAFSRKFPSLLLTASSDASVILWDIAQVPTSDTSSSPTSVTCEMREDRKVCTYTDNDESVYAVAWSLRDDWSFASLSYDGRLAVNKVPSAVKYRLLI